MSVFLREGQTGTAGDLIGFPHLLLCLGVVLQTKFYLYGCHFDRPSETEGLASAFASYTYASGGRSENSLRLYGVCNWKARYNKGGRSAWRAEMEQIAEALGYQGLVSGFDTSIIAPQDGTYVEFQREQAKRCRIFYKRNEKMGYTTGLVPGGEVRGSSFAAYERLGGGTNPFTKTKGMVPVTTAAAVSGSSKTSNLHELDYFLRLVSFEVG